jgi:hypothetical protein
VFALVVRLSEEFFLQHREVVSHDEPDLPLGPVRPGWLFIVQVLALLGDGEAELPQDEFGLAGGLAAAKLLGL